MERISFALTFKGSAAPPGDDPAQLKVRAQASSPATISGPLPGASATFESDVKMIDEGSFDESGSIDFGAGTRLMFSTVGRGAVGQSAEDGISAGTVIWRVDGGEGKLKGATGYITSNFFFSMTGDVTDNQLHVLFVP